MNKQLAAARFMALFLIEVSGIGLTFLALSDLPSILELDDHKVLGMPAHKVSCYLLLGLLVVTFILLAFSKPVMEQAWRFLLGIPAEQSVPSVLNWVDLDRFILITAICNFIFLDYAIWMTGGIRPSLFTPFILVMVPVYSLIGTSKRNLLIVFIITLLSFSAVLCTDLECPVQTDQTGKSHDLWYAAITTLCVIFPTGIVLFVRRGDVTSQNAADEASALRPEEDTGVVIHPKPGEPTTKRHRRAHLRDEAKDEDDLCRTRRVAWEPPTDSPVEARPSSS